jgi:hypothetical protein
MNDERRKVLEAASALGETSPWVETLAEDAESEEVERLTGVLKTEVGRFLEDPPQRKKTKATVVRPCPVPAAHFL